MNYTNSIVLGNPKFYDRFNYVESIRLGIKSPFNIAKEYYMVKVLKDNKKIFNSTVTYDKAFNL